MQLGKCVCVRPTLTSTPSNGCLFSVVTLPEQLRKRQYERPHQLTVTMTTPECHSGSYEHYLFTATLSQVYHLGSKVKINPTPLQSNTHFGRRLKVILSEKSFNEILAWILEKVKRKHRPITQVYKTHNY